MADEALDAVFGLRHLAHPHNAETSGDYLAGLDAPRMKEQAMKEQGA